MALFEIDNGRLAPAQFGRPADEEAQDSALVAVRQQIVEVLHRPLFPVVWESKAGGETLTALDPAGQVVTVEVVRVLDSATIVGAMARLAATASAGWADLAGRYQGGIQAFREDWNEFREAMPARVQPGPRLIVVAVEMADDVRSSLAVLTGSGVETHHLSVRQLASGRRFIEVEKVEPETVQGVGSLLRAREARPGLPAAPAAQDPSSLATAPTPASAPEDDAEPVQAGRSASSPEAPTAHGPAPEDHGGVDGGEAEGPALTQPLPTGRPAAEERGDHWAPEREEDSAPMAREEATAALGLVGSVLEGPTEVVWQLLRRGIFHQAVLAPSGTLTLADGSVFTDPSQAADAAQGGEGWDGWRVWRFGPHGPSLQEALDEVMTARAREVGAPDGSRGTASGPDTAGQRRPLSRRRRRAR